MSRYYGFTVGQIKEMTMYQFDNYMQNIHTYEKLAQGEESEVETENYTEDEIGNIAKDYGINIPE